MCFNCSIGVGDRLEAGAQTLIFEQIFNRIALHCGMGKDKNKLGDLAVAKMQLLYSITIGQSSICIS